MSARRGYLPTEASSVGRIRVAVFEYTQWRRRWPEVVVQRRTDEAVELLTRYYAVTAAGRPAYSGSQFEAMAALNSDPYSIGPADFTAASTGALASDVARRLEAEVPARFGLMADGDQLHRILVNLMRNARQAIEATRRPGTIEIGAGEDEAEWFIRVGDTGPGLPKKARDYLFQPFSGGSRKGGTGLGLAIAADLVRNHGGRLDLLRSDEEGTQFCLRLPRDLAGIPLPAEAPAA